jgi:phosphoribosylformylglycinamidine synthase
MMRARVLVTLRRGVLDPAGQAVCSGLQQLGFGEVREARLGKVIELELVDMSREEALRRLEAMGQKLLANTVIEDFTVEIV